MIKKVWCFSLCDVMLPLLLKLLTVTINYITKALKALDHSEQTKYLEHMSTLRVLGHLKHLKDNLKFEGYLKVTCVLNML